MILNVIVIFLTIIIGFLFWESNEIDVINKKKRKLYIIVISIILILQSGLRNVAVGADTYNYKRIFERIKTTNWEKIIFETYEYYVLDIGKDLGYSIFQKLIQYIISDFQIYLLFIAILFFLTLGRFIYKNTNRIQEAIFAFVLYSTLFYSFFSITGIRQTIATSITLWGYELIKKKKLFQFTILILLSSTIHKSVLIFLPFYFISRIKNVKPLLIAVLVAFPFLFLYKLQLTEFFGLIGGKTYAEYREYENAGTYTFTTMLILITLVALWRMDNIIRIEVTTKPFFIALILAIFFTPLTWVNPSTIRVVQYFSIFLILIVPHIINSFKSSTNKNNSFIIFLFTISLLIVMYLKSNMEHEYKFFWQEMKLGDNYNDFDFYE